MKTDGQKSLASFGGIDGNAVTVNVVHEIAQRLEGEHAEMVD